MKLKRIVAALMTGVMVVGSSPVMGAHIPVRASAVTMPDMVTNSAAAQPSKGIRHNLLYMLQKMIQRNQKHS